jgi:hypothetical protein
MSLIVFAAVVMVLQLLDVKKLSIFQAPFTVYRFVSFGLIFVSCVISLAYNGSFWSEDGFAAAAAAEPNVPHQPFYSWYAFRTEGIEPVVAATAFAFTASFYVPSLISALPGEKKYAHVPVALAMAICVGLYVVLSIIPAITLGPTTRNFLILNYARYGSRGFVLPQPHDAVAPPPIPTNTWSLIIKFVIMLFPVMNLISVFPLATSGLTASLYNSVPARIQTRLGPLGPPGLRIIVTCAPFILAVFIPTLGIIVHFVGMSAVNIGLLLPSISQLISIYKMRPHWKTPHSGFWSHPFLAVIVLLFAIFSIGFCIFEIARA